jgi:hypothetical protein
MRFDLSNILGLEGMRFFYGFKFGHHVQSVVLVNRWVVSLLIKVYSLGKDSARCLNVRKATSVITYSCRGVFSPLDLALGWKKAKNRVKKPTLWRLSKVFMLGTLC